MGAELSFQTQAWRKGPSQSPQPLAALETEEMTSRSLNSDAATLHFQRCLTREDSSLTTSGSQGARRHRKGRSSRTMRTRRMSPHPLMSA